MAKIIIETTVKAAIDKVWKHWTSPEDIVNWNHAGDDWHSPFAENNLKENGRFIFRMEAKDGSFGFDFSGIYDKVVQNQVIEYTLDDGRKVKIIFSVVEEGTKIEETFDAETENPEDMQKAGWQMILKNSKKYAENENGKAC
jgi:uncharacterized protein YndB with AHSA1/START domain